jgi:23S rRNA (cytosine1962-C5)-methyltransferase
MNALHLKKSEDRRVRAGHLWVFSNEIDTAVTPLKGLQAGEPIELHSATGKFLAHGYANPQSLISVRITGRRASQPFDADQLRARLTAALELRNALFDTPHYRWVHGEGDNLPGLVVDRFGSVLVVQITTAGMEAWREVLFDQLLSISGAECILCSHDLTARELEGLDRVSATVAGQAPECLEAVEHGVRFTVPNAVQQKTGWFYDHRATRQAVAAKSKGMRVLDLYSYIGGFGLQAACAGADQVVCVDSSKPALSVLETNAADLSVSATVQTIANDAVTAMRELLEAGERFDVVVLDPPAFIKRKKDKEAGTRHYQLNHKLALRLLAPGGTLYSASCSQAFSESDGIQAARSNVPREFSALQVLGSLRQDADHPVHGAMPETLYLTGFVARMI